MSYPPELAVASPWFHAEPVAGGVTLLTEPHVEPYFVSNVWHIRGCDRDLVVDTGNGFGDLRSELALLGVSGGRPIAAVVTHAHFDHVGSLWAFDERVCHAAEAPDVLEPFTPSLFGAELPGDLVREMQAAGYPVPEVTLRAVPELGFNPRAFRIPSGAPTHLVEDGDVVDLGDRTFEVLHTPGHTVGSICLWEEATGTLFTGDTAYVGDPLGIEDPDAFARSLLRLREVPVAIVHAGHNASFGRNAFLELIETELARLGG